MSNRCPECNSQRIKEDEGSPSYWSEGQDEWEEIHSYWCEDCGCEWTETLTMKYEIEIDKHGRHN
jgi:DNA-directed RNA polymerase subunit RPC12/RpoP